MPSRKQRRRRQKDRRHEYEFVYVDDEGQEVAVDELPAPSPNGKSARARTPKGKGRRERAGRTVEPASWRRAGRRGLLFAPFMFGILYLLNGDDVPLYGLVLNTLMLLAFFVPFGYLMDKVMYRTFSRRTGGAGAQKRRR